jgi:hypothetical protein
MERAVILLVATLLGHFFVSYGRVATAVAPGAKVERCAKYPPLSTITYA